MIFLKSASSTAALVFYLPGVCTDTDTKEKKEKGQSPEYFKITIFNEHPVAAEIEQVVEKKRSWKRKWKNQRSLISR